MCICLKCMFIKIKGFGLVVATDRTNHFSSPVKVQRYVLPSSNSWNQEKNPSQHLCFQTKHQAKKVSHLASIAICNPFHADSIQ